jgi:hypothetical protein
MLRRTPLTLGSLFFSLDVSSTLVFHLLLALLLCQFQSPFLFFCKSLLRLFVDLIQCRLHSSLGNRIDLGLVHVLAVPDMDPAMILHAGFAVCRSPRSSFGIPLFHHCRSEFACLVIYLLIDSSHLQLNLALSCLHQEPAILFPLLLVNLRGKFH